MRKSHNLLFCIAFYPWVVAYTVIWDMLYSIVFLIRETNGDYAVVCISVE